MESFYGGKQGARGIGVKDFRLGGSNNNTLTYTEVDGDVEKTNLSAGDIPVVTEAYIQENLGNIKFTKSDGKAFFTQENTLIWPTEIKLDSTDNTLIVTNSKKVEAPIGKIKEIEAIGEAFAVTDNKTVPPQSWSSELPKGDIEPGKVLWIKYTFVFKGKEGEEEDWTSIAIPVIQGSDAKIQEDGHTVTVNGTTQGRTVKTEFDGSGNAIFKFDLGQIADTKNTTCTYEDDTTDKRFLVLGGAQSAEEDGAVTSTAPDLYWENGILNIPGNIKCNFVDTTYPKPLFVASSQRNGATYQHINMNNNITYTQMGKYRYLRVVVNLIENGQDRILESNSYIIDDLKIYDGEPGDGDERYVHEISYAIERELTRIGFSLSKDSSGKMSVNVHYRDASTLTTTILKFYLEK